MYTEFTYNVYIPSQNKEVQFKPLLVKQFTDLLNCSYNIPFLNISFNLKLNEIIKHNIVTEDSITEFDKFVIALYIRQNDLSFDTTINSTEHPKDTTIQTIPCSVPTIEKEDEYLNYITSLLKQNNFNKDTLLIAEIAKYINWDISFEEKVKQTFSLSIDILAKIIKYIDSVKNTVAGIYKQPNSITLPYNVSLFIE